VRFLDVEKQEIHRVDINKGPSSHKLIKKLDISIGYVQYLRRSRLKSGRRLHGI
jgi:hypothetical protein